MHISLSNQYTKNDNNQYYTTDILYPITSTSRYSTIEEELDNLTLDNNNNINDDLYKPSDIKTPNTALKFLRDIDSLLSFQPNTVIQNNNNNDAYNYRDNQPVMLQTKPTTTLQPSARPNSTMILPRIKFINNKHTIQISKSRPVTSSSNNKNNNTVNTITAKSYPTSLTTAQSSKTVTIRRNSDATVSSQSLTRPTSKQQSNINSNIVHNNYIVIHNSNSNSKLPSIRRNSEADVLKQSVNNIRITYINTAQQQQQSQKQVTIKKAQSFTTSRS